MFIDIDTNQKLYSDDVRTRFMPIIYSDVNQLTLAQLHSVRVAKVIEVEQPVIKPYQTLTEHWTKIAGKWTQRWELAQLDLAKVKSYQLSLITIAFNRRALEPVRAFGLEFAGGESSAQTIYNETIMAEMDDGRECHLYDITGTIFMFSIADARAIAKTLSDKFKALLFEFKNLERAINFSETESDVLSHRFE